MKKEWRDLALPGRDFLYVSGRPYLPLEPKREGLPYVLTEERGEELRKRIGEVVEVRFDSSPRMIPGPMMKEYYAPFCRFLGTLEDAVRIPVCTDGITDPMYRVWDWVYRLKIGSTDDDLRVVGSRKDEWIGTDHAYDHATMHWGTERWSRLTLEILSEGTSLIRTDVDVFAPSGKELDPYVVVGLHSHIPDRLRAFRRE